MDWDAKVLVVYQWCVEVKIFDINIKPLIYGGRYGTINDYFGLSNVLFGRCEYY